MAEITLTSANFEEEVLKSDKPVLVDFWATWCGPCKMVGPIVAQIAEEKADTLKVGKLNVDDVFSVKFVFECEGLAVFTYSPFGKLSYLGEVKSNVGEIVLNLNAACAIGIGTGNNDILVFVRINTVYDIVNIDEFG